MIIHYISSGASKGMFYYFNGIRMGQSFITNLLMKKGLICFSFCQRVSKSLE